MVRKIKKKKQEAEVGTLNMDEMDDLRPVLCYWFNLIGESEETKMLFDDCRSKKDILLKFYELMTEKHKLIKKLDYFRESVAPAMKEIHSGLKSTEDVMNHTKKVDEALKTKTPLGYWETLKTLQTLILSTYLNAGREDELPLYDDKESDSMPDPLLITIKKG